MSISVGISFRMNTFDEALFAHRLADAGRERDIRIQRFVIPSFTAIRKVGGRDMYWEASGAWTGEVSPMIWRECQRKHFGQTDKTSEVVLLAPRLKMCGRSIDP